MPAPSPRRAALPIGLALASLVTSVACTPPPPARPPVEATSPPPMPAVSPPAPRTEADRDRDFTLAWTEWSAGNRTEAIAAFQKLARELDDLPTKSNAIARQPGVPLADFAVNSDATRAVALSGGGAFWFDGDGAPLHHDASDAATVAFLPHSSYAVLHGIELRSTHLEIVDGTTFTRVLFAPDVTGWVASPSGTLVVYVERTAAGLERIHVWDVATKTERRVIDLRAAEWVVASSVGFSPDEKELFAVVNVTDGGEQLALFGDDGARLDFPHAMDNAAPSFSVSGKYAAYAYTSPSDKGPGGTTVLVDRATRKLVASTAALRYPTATRFSNNGKYLVVGELRRVSILEVPSLRVVAHTPFLRDTGRYGDDEQNIVRIEMVGGDAGFWAVTADMTNGVFRLPSGALVWKGRGDRSVGEGGVQRFNGRDDGKELVTIDARLAVSKRPLLQTELDAPADPAMEKLYVRVQATVCTLGKRIFPIDACGGSPPH